MEKTSPNIISLFFSFSILDGFLLFCRISSWVIRIQNSSSSFLSFLQSQLGFLLCSSEVLFESKNPNPELLNRQICHHEKVNNGKLWKEDVETVMEKLGIFRTQDDEKLQDRLDLDELSVLFEEKEPSLEEVKEAFDVFDENKDGFIDARELQKVLFSLDFWKGTEVEECKRMIKAFDGNGDEQIDFGEFVKFMENIFC